VSPRLAAMALLLAALGLRFLVAVPALREAAAEGEAYRRARDERRVVTRQLEAADRREARRASALALVSRSDNGAGDPVTRLRRDALASIRESGVSAVRLSVAPSRAPVAATLQMSAAGSLEEVTRLSTDLTTRRGLILQRVRFTPREPVGVALDIDGGRLGGGS
jgi:hypothetical protein